MTISATPCIDATMREALCGVALDAGFDLMGIAPADPAGSDAAERLRERFTEWIALGREAEMGYLRRLNEQGELMRASLHAAMPWARSVIVCALNYNSAAPRSIEDAPDGSGWIARYAWSGMRGVDDTLVATDYHDVMLERLRRVEEQLVQLAGREITTRSYIDTGPIVERHFAEVAGLGWIGKNACLLNQEKGSWLLLGVIVTSLPLADEATLLPAADRCGSCTRCIEACPTDALVAERQMDAGRCISYLTIEKKGNIPEELRPLMGRQVFGCDICQDVCPWNRKAPIGHGNVMESRAELINPQLEWLASMDNREFRAEFKGSPLERTGRKRLQRNVAVAMGNSGDLQHLERLRAWAGGEDAVLAEHAKWAIGRIEKVEQKE